MVNVAILGYGTVGSGVFEVINTNNAVISERVGEEVNVKYVLDLRDFPGDPVEEKLVHDVDIIMNDPDVQIVVEVMGGVKPSYEFVKRALEGGKSVCTSNKELVAKHGVEFLAIAKEKHVNFLFEASCGGGIPIIRPLNTSVTGDVIDEVTGILNGTTNYILSKMSAEGSDFAEVLKDAQDKGYAERNPEADVEGHDARRKIAILSSIAYGKDINFEDVYTEGITGITADDIKYANAIGTSIKLLGTSRQTEDGVYAMVSPVMIDNTTPLFSVNDVFNAIFIHGNMLGDAMFYGSGAGKLPTASAVVGDVVEAARNQGRTLPVNWTSEKQELMDIGDVKNRFFVRVKGSDETQAKELFGEIEIIRVPELADEFAFVTPLMTENTFKAQAEKLEGMISRIRARI